MADIAYFHFPEGRLTPAQFEQRAAVFADLDHKLHHNKLGPFGDIAQGPGIANLLELGAVVVELGDDVTAVPGFRAMQSRFNAILPKVPFIACSSVDRIAKQAGSLGAAAFFHLGNGGKTFDDVALGANDLYDAKVADMDANRERVDVVAKLAKAFVARVGIDKAYEARARADAKAAAKIAAAEKAAGITAGAESVPARPDPAITAAELRA